tara:strand:+ start:108 stop:440 length:333 start_codon:yes stop_codon:yes gene_type:complete
MNKFVVPFSLLVASILVFVLVFLFVEKHDIYTDSKTTDECTAKHNQNLTKDGQECGVWDVDNCWKGKYHAKDGTCVKPADYVDLGLLILSVGLFIAFIVTLIMATHKKVT